MQKTGKFQMFCVFPPFVGYFIRVQQFEPSLKLSLFFPITLFLSSRMDWKWWGLNLDRSVDRGQS